MIGEDIDEGNRSVFFGEKIQVVNDCIFEY